MIKERSAGAIIFRKEKDKIKYLLLHYKYKGEYWGFPKGNIEKGESEIDTAKREIEEETGITDIKFLEGFKERVHYFYRREGQMVSKDVIFFLGKTRTKEVKISWEHVGYEWVDFDTAMKRLKPNSRKILEKANKFITSSLTKWL